MIIMGFVLQRFTRCAKFKVNLPKVNLPKVNRFILRDEVHLGKAFDYLKRAINNQNCQVDFYCFNVLTFDILEIK